MESLEPDQQQFDRFEFWVDEYDYLFQPTRGCLSIIAGDSRETDTQLQFKDLFGDNRTFVLFSTILAHVRKHNSSITFPYRCDSDTCTYHYQALISKSNEKYVVFASNLLDRDLRPNGVVWKKRFRSKSENRCHHPVCSVCGRVEMDDEWYEFQQLVDDKRWSAFGETMDCEHELCEFCENAVLQRVSDMEIHISQLRKCA